MVFRGPGGGGARRGLVRGDTVSPRRCARGRRVFPLRAPGPRGRASVFLLRADSVPAASSRGSRSGSRCPGGARDPSAVTRPPPVARVAPAAGQRGLSVARPRHRLGRGLRFVARGVSYSLCGDCRRAVNLSQPHRCSSSRHSGSPGGVSSPQLPLPVCFTPNRVTPPNEEIPAVSHSGSQIGRAHV